MSPVKDRTKPTRFFGSESRLQAAASRNASTQLLRIPWSIFRKDYEEYPRWQALALWGEAIIRVAGCAPRSVLSTVNNQCPGFAALDEWQKSPAFYLLEWAHTNRFGEAKQEDWLNALIFYGVRQPASRAVWTYFEQCEEQWRRRPPASFPSFEQWWRFAQRARLRGSPTSAVVSQEVENFVEWKDFSLWLQPLFLGAIGLPPHALSEIESRCAGLADLSEANAMRRATTRSSLWRRITRVCEDRAVLRAKREGWVGILLEQVESHPLHVRTQAYAAHWKEEWNRDQLSRYPSLAEWKQAAAKYVNSDRP